MSTAGLGSPIRSQELGKEGPSEKDSVKSSHDIQAFPILSLPTCQRQHLTTSCELCLLRKPSRIHSCSVVPTGPASRVLTPLREPWGNLLTGLPASTLCPCHSHPVYHTALCRPSSGQKPSVAPVAEGSNSLSQPPETSLGGSIICFQNSLSLLILGLLHRAASFFISPPNELLLILRDPEQMSLLL